MIFTGTIANDRVDEREQTRTLTFAVDRVFKGEATATEVVTSHASGASCGLEISGPGPLVVFADQGRRAHRQSVRRHARRLGARHLGHRPAAHGRPRNTTQRRAARTARLHGPVGAAGRPLPRRHRGRHRRQFPDQPAAGMTMFARNAALALTGVLLALVAAWLSPAPAYACSCVTDSEPELARNAEVIFTGTVTEDRAIGDTRTYTFAVDRVYRGHVLTTQTVRTHTQGPACGLDLAGPGPYLVLGYLRDGVLLANSCGGTRAGAPPAELGAGNPPQTSSAPTGVTWTPANSGLTLVIGAAFIGLAVYLARRRSGRPEG